MSDRGEQEPPHSGRHENHRDRLRRTTTREVMSVELVSAFAGDRAMTEAEEAEIRLQHSNRGDVFFSDLFFAISHQYFAPEIARALWDTVLEHKLLLSTRLERNVRITVAALDYLSNVTGAMTAPTLISEARVAEMANLSMRDGMTGLFNHTSCYELLDLEFRSRRRYGIGLAVLLLDIDDFKEVNDQRGHQEGDRVLVELARVLVGEARDSDICCRLGGDEFVVILRLTNDAVQACEIAERIRAKARGIRSGGKQLTVSVGVALCDHLTNGAQALIETADRALRTAKAEGKDRVVLDVPEERGPSWQAAR